MVVLLAPAGMPGGHSSGGEERDAGVVCTTGNPFSLVAGLAVSSSSEEEDDEDEGSSHSDSSSQIVSSLRQPRQRVRLLATFRLSAVSACPDAGWAGAEDHALATSATTVATFRRGAVPQMVELDRETDLTVPPPDWRTAGGRAEARGGARTHQLVASVHAENDSAAMTDALASLVGAGPDVSDFVASAATMKTIFGLATSNTKVTVAVHRVDDKTLVLNGVINGKTRSGVREAPLPHSAPGEHGGEPTPPVISCADGSTGSKAGGNGETRAKGRRRKKKRSADADHDAAQADPSSSLYSKFMYYSASAGDLAEPEIEKDIREGLIQEGLDGEEEASEQLEAERGNTEGEGQVFRRAVHFQFQNLNLLLGSDTVIFNRGARTSELSLRLQDMDSEIPKLTCLDYWLDNIFNQVPHTAVCYHKEGKVHGYQLVRTQDIPSWSGFAFEPKAVMETASSVPRAPPPPPPPRKGEGGGWEEG